MTDTIKFNNQEYEVKQKLSFGEVRKFQKSLSGLIGLDEKIKNATPEELEKIATEGLKSTEEQMDIVQNTLVKCLGFTQEQLDVLSYPDAVVLFNEVFTNSTQLKKKLDQPYV